MGELYRIEATMAIMDWNVNEEVRRSILREVHESGSDDFKVGGKVAYWRDQALSGRKRAAYILGIFAGYVAGLRGRGEDNYACVASGGRLIQVKRWQLRRAVETWTPSREGVHALRRLSKCFGKIS